MAGKSITPQRALPCIIDGCERKRSARGYCANHYARWRYYGDATKGRDRTKLGEPLRWIERYKDYQGDDCLRWPFEITRYGYGTVKHNGKKRVASRVMCEIPRGLPPYENMDAAHDCGNGQHGCMNPKHLIWKTRQGNVDDKQRHGTQQHGDKVWLATTTKKKAREILALRGQLKQKEIAKKVGVTVGVVAKIQSGGSWEHLAEEMGYKYESMAVSRGEKSGNAKLTRDDVREIRHLRGQMYQKDIAALYGIDKSYVGKIQRREWWSWLDG